MLSPLDSLHVVGSRVLIEPDRGETRTDAGLILPAGVRAKDEVEGGRVAKVGPGHLMANPEYSDAEPWAPARDAVRYLPLQAHVGDYALFLKKDAIEVEISGATYLIVSHGALLALQRPTHPEDDPDFA
ncbi:MAG: co-chaperone GroES family protein [Bacteroidota bacterium]